MNFSELTRVMLSSMDFFELRRTAARYGVPYQGVRRSKLLRDLEKKITSKGAASAADIEASKPKKIMTLTNADKKPRASRRESMRQ